MSDRVLIAGTNSGCGKTTVTCALLAALKKRKLSVSAFKCGPDYIDPMFHRKVIGIPSYNLDPFFCTGEQLKSSLARRGGEISVIEGVMGYYDGIGTDGHASTYELAKETETPVVLVVNAKGMYTSAGAIIRGFYGYKAESNVKGVIFNGVSPMMYDGLKKIAADAGVKALGFLPNDDSVSVGSRHLGLITAEEIDDIRAKMDRLGELAEKYLDLDGILSVAADAPALETVKELSPAEKRARIAVAKDEAFCFMYEENIELLKEIGCEIEFFSPLHDKKLPENISGIWLPGGYPELYAEKLSENGEMLSAVRGAINSGVPTVAECGGFLYLHKTLDGLPMAGVIDADAFKTKKLQRFGYVTLTAQKDNLLCRAGEKINAHSFHYYESTDNGGDFLAEKPFSERSFGCVHAGETLYAGFPHIYLPANPSFAENFVSKSEEFAKRNKIDLQYKEDKNG